MWGRLPQIRAFLSRSPRPGAPGILAQSPVHPGRGKLLPKAVAGNRFLILSSHEGEGIGVHLL